MAKQRIAEYRKSLGLSQVELAKIASVSQSTIAQIETGKKDPSLNTLLKISKALKIHVASLLVGKEVFAIDLAQFRRKYKSVSDLSDSDYRALSEISRFCIEIGMQI